MFLTYIYPSLCIHGARWFTWIQHRKRLATLGIFFLQPTIKATELPDFA